MNARHTVTGLVSLLTSALCAMVALGPAWAAPDCTNAPPAGLGGVEAGAPGTGTCTVSGAPKLLTNGGTFNIDRTLVIQTAIDASNDVPAALVINVCVDPVTFLPTFPDCDIRIETGGSIDASDDAGDNEPGDDAKAITLRASRDLLMVSGTSITAEGRVGAGTGGDITIVVGRNVALNNNAGVGPGATISSSRVPPATAAGAGNVPGDIFIKAGPDPQSTIGQILIQEFSVVKANSISQKAGRIDLIAGNSITVHGEVLSEAQPGDNLGEGGPIFLISCTVAIGDEGVVSSKGNDAGADLVHLEGCFVTIEGLVRSTGPGHGDQQNKLCRDADRGPAHVQANRPGFDGRWHACVEVWSGTTIVITETAEVHADIGQSGGVNGGSWIDLFARGNIDIQGDALAPFAVHANMVNQNNSKGGLVTIKSLTGDVLFSGLAVQADADTGAAESGGGQIILQAGGNITSSLPTPTLSAQGDNNAAGTFGEGGLIELRSFAGNVSWLNGEGNVLPTGTNVDLADRGIVRFFRCAGDTVTLTGTVFPSNGAPTTPEDVAVGACGGSPTLPAYVLLPSNCSTQACGQGPGGGNGECTKSSVASVMDATTGRFPGNLGFDAVIEVHNGDIIQPFVDAAADSNGDGYILLLVVAKDNGQLGGHTTQNVAISNQYPDPFGLIACSVTLHAQTAGSPTGSITAGAGAPSPPGGLGNIFVMDLHGADSAVAGWRVQGDGRYLRNVNTLDNAVGIDITGDDNIVHNGTNEGNSGAGIRVTGSGNIVTGAKAFDNDGHGIEVVGDSNTVSKTDAGDRGKGNTGDGIHVEGSFNDVLENDVYDNGGDGIGVVGNNNELKKNNAGDRGKGNTGDGIQASGDDNTLTENDAFANAVHGFNIVGSGNTLKLNRAGDSSKGNLQDGFHVEGSDNVFDLNRASANGDDGFDFASAAGTNNTLKANKSNDGASGGNKENVACEYRFAEGSTNDAGGNKEDNANFIGVAGKYPAGCRE